MLIIVIYVCFVQGIHLNDWPQATIYYGSQIFCAWVIVDSNYSKTYFYNMWCRTYFSKMLRTWKQCCIKILPDVGIVRMYPKVHLQGGKCWLGYYKVTDTPPCSWTFCASWFFHAATHGFRDAVHHPYISTCFFLWETFLLPLFLCFLWSASCMTCKHKLLALSIYVATNSCPNMAVSMASLV